MQTFKAGQKINVLLLGTDDKGRLKLKLAS
jgi:hypothetical protein